MRYPQTIWNRAVFDKDATTAVDTTKAVETTNTTDASKQVAETATVKAATDATKATPPVDQVKAAEVTKTEAAPLTAKDITIPEGFTADDPTVAKFLGIMNDGKLDGKSRTNALVTLQAEVMKAASERNSTLWQEVQDKWVVEAKALPDIGGQNFDKTMGGIRKFLDTYGSKDLDAALDLTGLGNNPHFIKFLDRMAKATAEGKPLHGNPGGGPKDLAEILYPNQGKS